MINDKNLIILKHKLIKIIEKTDELCNLIGYNLIINEKPFCKKEFDSIKKIEKDILNRYLKNN